MLIFFRDGKVKKCNVKELVGNDRTFAPVLSQDSKFNKVSIQVGGYGICWGENLMIPDELLYAQGNTIPLMIDDFIRFVQERIISTSEAADLLLLFTPYI